MNHFFKWGTHRCVGPASGAQLLALDWRNRPRLPPIDALGERHVSARNERARRSRRDGLLSDRRSVESIQVIVEFVSQHVTKSVHPLDEVLVALAEFLVELGDFRPVFDEDFLPQLLYLLGCVYFAERQLKYKLLSLRSLSSIV